MPPASSLLSAMVLVLLIFTYAALASITEGVWHTVLTTCIPCCAVLCCVQAKKKQQGAAGAAGFTCAVPANRNEPCVCCDVHVPCCAVSQAKKNQNGAADAADGATVTAAALMRHTGSYADDGLSCCVFWSQAKKKQRGAAGAAEGVNSDSSGSDAEQEGAAGAAPKQKDLD